MRKFLYSFVGIFFFSFLHVVFVSPVFADSNVVCTQYTLPVTLSPTDPTIYHEVGFLCSNGSMQGKTVQLLVHGLTYNHLYWDFPFPSENSQAYSYVHNALDAGYVTFSVDQLGAGASDHPAPDNVTSSKEAYVLHQIIIDLKNGSIGNTVFNKVILVSHSFGSVASAIETSQYNDASGLILTGALHTLGTNAPLVTGALYPAQNDPKFANSNLPVGYLTTIPGKRSVFYNVSDADAKLINLDESLKDAGPEGLFFDLGLFSNPATTQNIHIPVLTAVGQFDNLYCDSVLTCTDNATVDAREAPDYSSQACLETFVLQNAGHDINLHVNAQNWYNVAADWANRRVGSSVNNPPTQLCQ